MNNNAFPFETTLGSFLPHRLHMRLSGKGENYTPELANLKEMATWVHENTHFLQTIFTGYGQIAWDSHRQMTSFLVREWVKGHTQFQKKKFRIPLSHYAKFSPEHLTSALVIDRTFRDVITIGKARFWMDTPGVKISDLSLKLLNKPWVANPTIIIDGKTHILQGKEVIEGHAQFAEVTLIEQYTKITREDAWCRETLPSKYLVAFDWFMEQCGESHYSTFPFICDLALQTSWDPVVPTTEEEWHASSPSWRFVRLTKMLRTMRHLHLGEPDKWSKTYNVFASSLLDACNFKSLDCIYEERLTAINRKEILLSLETIMKRAILFRKEIPWCAGNPIANMELWEKIKNTFPAPIVEINGSFKGVALGGERENTEILFELQFQALAAQIFGDFSSAALREKSIECAFSKFDIPQGCEYQKSHFCSGRYCPSNGPPHIVSQTDDQKVKGCSFEYLLNLYGTCSTDLDIDHFAQLPKTNKFE